MTFDSIDALKNTPGTELDNYAKVFGYYYANDKGGGDFYWDAESTEAEDSGLIFEVLNISKGRWKRIFSNVVYIEWFGVKGDGVADDCDAIDLAIQKCPPGVQVIFNNTYLIKGKQPVLNSVSRLTDGFRIKSGISLSGAGTFILHETACYVINTKVVTDVSEATNPIRDIVIDGLTFKAQNNTFFEFCWSVCLGAADNVTIRNCNFIGFRGDAISIGASTNNTLSGWLKTWVSNIKIYNCLFDGINKDNRNAISILFAKNILIRDNEFRNCSRANMPGAIDIEPEDTDAIIEDVKIVYNSFSNIGGGTGVFSLTFWKKWAELINKPKNIQFSYNKINNVNTLVYIYQNNPDTELLNDFDISICYNDCKSFTRLLQIDGISGIEMNYNNFSKQSASGLIGQSNKVRNFNFSKNQFYNCRIPNYLPMILMFKQEGASYTTNTFSDVAYQIFNFNNPGVSTGTRIIDNIVTDQTANTEYFANIQMGHAFTYAGLIIMNNVFPAIARNNNYKAVYTNTSGNLLPNILDYQTIPVGATYYLLSGTAAQQGLYTWNGNSWTKIAPVASVSANGTVKQSIPQTDSAAVITSDLVSDFNSLLGKLRAAGILST